MTMEMQVNKSGIDWLEISLSMNKDGLEIFLRANKKLEDFMAGLSGGSSRRSTEYASEWIPEDPDKPILVYDMIKNIPELGKGISLESVGEGVYPFGNNTINLSFLRIVGISNPTGVTFTIAGPVSSAKVRTIATDVLAGCKSIINTYLIPVTVSLKISSQEF